jgi:CPA2 family monovalent cation:H+ antiporter-2
MTIAVIETDLHRIQQLRAAGIPAVYGDASHASILNVIHIERARLVVVALPDAGTTRAVVREIRRVNPTLPILARAPRIELEDELRAAGATSTIAPERAGALLMLEEGLRLLDLPQADNGRLATPDTLAQISRPLSA